MSESSKNTTTYMGSSSNSIEVQEVTHTYDRLEEPVLNNINLQLKSGFYGLLGTNGAGKSTLMRIICTLLRPTLGQVKVNGLDIATDAIAIRRNLGYLPQAFSAWRHMRTEEVVDSLARISGLTDKKQRRARVREVIEEVGLDSVADRRVKKLSGGMVRRLGVAQSLVHDPTVLVVDEPTVGLDPEERIRFRQLMAELGRSRTILCSTHIVSDLGSGCKEIALLDEGKIAYQDTPLAFLEKSKGSVFEATVNQETAANLETQYEIVSRETTAESVTLRLVLDRDSKPPENATPVDSPTLEEAYLAFMGSIGKFEAIRADQEADLAAESDKKSKKKKKKAKS